MVAIGNTLWKSACADSRSNAHGFAAYAGTLLFKCVTGILPGPEAGYERPIIAPLPGALRWGRGVMRTGSGTIGVNWQKDTDFFELTVSLPKEMKATVVLPPEAAAVSARNGELPGKNRYEITGTTKFKFSDRENSIILSTN